MKKAIIKVLNFVFNLVKGLFIRKTVIGENAVDRIVKQKFNFLGSSTRRKGQRLYSYNKYTEEITEVPILKKQGLDGYRGFINPDNLHVWAINYKNAKRKLLKFAKEENNNNSLILNK